MITGTSPARRMSNIGDQLEQLKYAASRHPMTAGERVLRSDCAGSRPRNVHDKPRRINSVHQPGDEGRLQGPAITQGRALLSGTPGRTCSVSLCHLSTPEQAVDTEQTVSGAPRAGPDDTLHAMQQGAHVGKRNAGKAAEQGTPLMTQVDKFEAIRP